MFFVFNPFSCITFLTDDERYTLYAGRYVAFDSFLVQGRAFQALWKVMLEGKTLDLFVDAATAHMNEANLKYNACKQIESLIGYVLSQFMIYSFMHFQ